MDTVLLLVSLYTIPTKGAAIKNAQSNVSKGALKSIHAEGFPQAAEACRRAGGLDYETCAAEGRGRGTVKERQKRVQKTICSGSTNRFVARGAA